MSVQIQPFDCTAQGQPVQRAILKQSGIEVHILSYAAVVQQLWVPDKMGRMVDVVLGYEDTASYEIANNGMGSVIGRFANRIGGARFTLNGTTYPVTDNQNGHCLHSGAQGFGRMVFSMEPEGENAVLLSAVSPDGTDGFPGSVTLNVRYALEQRGLVIHYTAVTTAPTVINMTNHSFFNLNGHASGSALEHRLQLAGDAFLETDRDSIPTGRRLPVQGTPMDFMQEKPLKPSLDADFAPIRLRGGFDHCYAVPGSGLRHFAWLTGPDTGIRMQTLSTVPGVQLFTANGLRTAGGVHPKEGAVYTRHNAVCLETENFPDAPNHPEFPSAALFPGQRYDAVTVYRFDVAPH